MTIFNSYVSLPEGMLVITRPAIRISMVNTPAPWSGNVASGSYEKCLRLGPPMSWYVKNRDKLGATNLQCHYEYYMVL